jgi:hypothetical protein
MASDERMKRPEFMSLLDQVKRFESPTLNLTNAWHDSFASKLASMQKSVQSPLLEFSRMQASQFSQIAEQAQRTLRIVDMARASSAFQMAEITSAHSAATKAMQLDLTRHLRVVTDTITAAARQKTSVFAQSMTGGSQLKFQSVIDELRARNAFSLAASAFEGFSADSILRVDTRVPDLPDLIREVVDRQVAETQTAERTTDRLPGTPASAHPKLAWDEWLANQPAAVQIMILFILVFFLQPAVEGAWHAAMVRWLDSSQQSRPQIVIEIHESFGADRATNLRCVRGQGLNVRAAPGKDSHVIGRLNAGQPVEVLAKRGSFSQVRFRDSNTGETREGWAASGYLINVECAP